ncbi:MAG: TonB-dependent receptor [Bacteroidetes bacterium]|nr:TonB-dependent receptor [Bacteroidota bacterium]
MTNWIKIFSSLLILMTSVFCQEFSYNPADLSSLTLEELLDITISTAGKKTERLGVVPASTVIISKEEIEILGFETINEIIGNIPGLFAIDDYEAAGVNFGVRGFWDGVNNRNIVILVNGVNYIFDFFSNYPIPFINIPVEAIDRIEVVRGPMSVLYGSGAFFGVINIFTNEVRTNSEGFVNISYGSNDTRRLSARTAGRLEDFKYVFNLGYFDTDGYDVMISDLTEADQIAVPLTSSTSGKLEYQSKYFQFNGLFNDFSFHTSYIESDKETYTLFPSIGDGSIATMKSTRLYVGYEKRVHPDILLDAKLTYNVASLSTDYKILYDGFYGIERTETEAYEAELKALINISPQSELTVGAYFRNFVNAENMYDLPSFGGRILENNLVSIDEPGGIQTHALYSQINYSILDNLEIVGGIRLERSPDYAIKSRHTFLSETTDPTQSAYEVITNDVEGVYHDGRVEIIPRIAAIYEMDNNNIFKLSYAEGIKRPGLFQNSKNSLQPENPELRPERIKTVEFEYATKLFGEIYTQINLYHNILENLIKRVIIVDEHGDYTSWNDNAGEMITNGLELTFKANLIKDLHIELSATFQNTTDERPEYKDYEVPYSPARLLYLKGWYNFSDDIRLGISGNYVDKMQTLVDMTLQNEDGSYGKRIGDESPPYFKVDANLSFQNIPFERIDLRIRVSNLFDSEIRYPTYTNNPWMTKGALDYGRRYFLGLKYNF